MKKVLFITMALICLLYADTTKQTNPANILKKKLTAEEAAKFNAILAELAKEEAEKEAAEEAERKEEASKIKKLPLKQIKTRKQADIYFEPSVSAYDWFSNYRITKGYVKFDGFEIYKVQGNLALVGWDYNDLFYIKFEPKSYPLREGLWNLSGYGKPAPNINGKACLELLWLEE